MIKYLTYLLAAVLLISACRQRPSDSLDVDMDDVDPSEVPIADESMNQIIENIASPIEAAALIQSLNVPYSSAYLADPEKLSTNTTSFEMAYTLGVLTADLGYLNIYEKTGTAVNYLTTINRLADALQIGQFFDFATLKRLATTSSDLDSLMFLSVNSFNNMDEYLRETGRSNLSALMIAGVWMEGLYLSTQVAKQNSNEDLKSMIGEQKLILNDLLAILGNYAGEPAIKAYIEDLQAIRQVYEDVRITYEVGDSETIEQDGMLLVVQNETSVVEMSDETLQRIIETTREIRNRQVNL